MKKWSLVILLLTTAVAACRKPAKPRLLWNVSLSAADTAPYGTKVAYELTRHYFPNAKIEALPARFRYTSIDGDMHFSSDGKALLVAVGLQFYLGGDEMDELLRFVREGNEAVIFCNALDEKLEQKLRATVYGGSEEFAPDANYSKAEDNLNILTLESAPGKRFGHNGRDLGGYIDPDTAAEFASGDTALATILGTEYNDDDDADYDTYVDDYDSVYAPDALGRSKERLNFLRFAYGNGHLTLHTGPLTLTNYFLLQKDNRRYLDGVWSTLPDGIGAVYWHEYFKRTAESSSLGILWRHPATRWALLLSILALGLYVLFESKRRQRVLPIVTAPQNTSVAFVETVGRLYYARADHANMAAKMVQHFLEGVRNAYGISTTELNDAFAETLSRKSGRSPREAAAAMFMAREVRGGNFAVTEEYIHRLYATLQAFHATTHA